MTRWRAGSAFALVVTLLAAASHAYQFRTHNGITRAARTQVREHPPAGVHFDEDFLRLLKDAGDGGFGDLIDSRAGDPYEDAWLDEDHEEGRLDPTVVGCR